MAFDGEVFAAGVTGARALLTASDFGFAAGLAAADFLAGFGAFATASTWAGFTTVLAGAFLAPRFGLPPPFATRSSISAMASGSVMVSWVLSLGMVALTPPRSEERRVGKECQ